MDPVCNTSTYSALELVADATALVDNHAHPFWVPSPKSQHSACNFPSLSQLITEAHPLGHPAPPHDGRATLAFSRALREMHALLIPSDHPPSSSRRSSSSLSSPTSPDRVVAVGPVPTVNLSTPAIPSSAASASASASSSASSPPSHAFDAPSPAELTVEACRRALGPWDLARRCFSAAGVAAVLIDDGVPIPSSVRRVELPDFPTRLGVPVARRVLRLEVEAARILHRLILQNRGGVWRKRPPAPYDSPDKRPRTTLRAHLFRDAVHAAISPLPPDVVAFKSIAAYRSGLAIRLDWTDVDIEEALDSLPSVSSDAFDCGRDAMLSDDSSRPFSRRTQFDDYIDLDGTARGGDSDVDLDRRFGLDDDDDDSGNPPLRLENKVLVDCVVREGLRAAREHGIPIQFHCGLGDVDTHLPEANPVHLRAVLQQFPDVAVVLLHGSWPYTREAAYLASVYPRVYLDIGLAIPLLSVRGMLRVVEMALEIAPVTKILYSSDAHSAPDMFYLAARWGRRAVATALAAAVACGDLDQTEAKAAVHKILAENAAQLYKLPMTL